MFLTAILLDYIVIFASARIINMPDLFMDNNDFHLSDVIKLYPFNNYVNNNDQLWILPLNEQHYDSMNLRSPTSVEEMNYLKISRPLIKRFEAQERSRVKKDDPEESEEDETASETTGVVNLKTPDFRINDDKNEFIKIKNKIFRLVNKFSLTILSEPDIYLTETADAGGIGVNTKIALYFKGPYTTLIIQAGPRRRHYFLEPPSPFPEWFHEKHTNIVSEDSTTFVEVPEYIRNEFLKKLLLMLQNFLNFTV